MADHHAAIDIASAPDQIFAFLADPLMLPRWLPMLRESFREGPDRIRVIGGGIGASGLTGHARFVAEPGQRTLSWATGAEIGCAGDIRVDPVDGGSRVAICLRLAPRAERPEVVAHWTGDAALDLEAALRATLEAIRLVCEDRIEGVTLVSGGTQAHPDQAPLRDSREFGTSATHSPASPETVRRRR